MASFVCIKLVILVQLHIAISCDFLNLRNRKKIFPSSNLTNDSCINLIQSSRIQSNIEIVFSTQESYFLTKDVTFNRKTGFHLLGSSGVANISCKENTGIEFVDITNLQLEQLHISGCGNEHLTNAISITNCTHVTITRVTFERNQKTGLALFNVEGLVVLMNCSFLSNTFNNQPTSVKNISNDFYGKGGGMLIVIGNRQTRSIYTMTNCTFQNNIAADGGGLFLVIRERAQRNTVNIVDTVFEHNKCENVGGGLDIEFVRNSRANNNRITVKKCRFLKNSALVGGGTAFHLSRGLINNDITFEECHWEKNNASFGMAVDITMVPWERILSGEVYLPSLVFMNCVFRQNANPCLSDTSTLAITGFNVQFVGLTIFEKNSGSCIDMTATVLEFHAKSNVSFRGNHGVRGAAIRMEDDSVIQFHDDSFFLFIENSASVRGGAFNVQYVNKRVFFSPNDKCFLHYVGDNKVPRNVTFEFENNFAGCMNCTKGNSIFITYVTPCLKNCIVPFVNHSISASHACLGSFVFDKYRDERNQILTSGSHFVLTGNAGLSNEGCKHIMESSAILTREGAMHFIPGKSEALPLKLMNDLGSEMTFEVSTSVIKKNSSVYLDPTQSLLTNKSLIVHGKPGDTACIRLSAFEILKFDLTFKLVLEECPPGYVYKSISKKCECSNGDKYYRGIRSCNDTIFQATVHYGYWIGRVGKGNEILGSAICPNGYCTKNYHKRQPKINKLPLNAKANISDYVCNKQRKGVVCGSCRENRSVHYNSEYFNCGSNELCHLGWLFYILSELIPVTILFLIIIVFNVSFTSGPLNGVIFFIQMVGTLKIQAENFIWFHPSVYRLKQVHQFIYFIFSLDFFHVGKDLSFCLWEGATALDMLAFRYVTILYSLVLVIVTVFLLRQCNCSICGKTLPTFNGSIIHGLSAFLVMSYSVCTRVSLLILTPLTLHIGPDYRNNPKYEFVAYYNGDYSYMGAEHLRYAIPAIFFIITVAIIPPMLLLSYPLCYKLFALLRIDESKFVQIVCKVIPLEKIKPLFDSMQGAFKDRYRFFAGLYFLYRLLCLLSFALSDSFTEHYILTGVFLVLMLAAHGAFRPYKKGWQNILEAGLFFNLFIVNILTFSNYNLVRSNQSNESIVIVLTAVQNIVILLPLLYLVSYIVYCLYLNLRSLCRQRHFFLQATDDSDNMLSVLDNRDSDSECKEEAEMEYQLM